MKRAFFITLLTAILAVSCTPDQEEVRVYRTWDEIVESDTLRIGTMTSPNDFYLIQGEPLGSEYQKILDFTKENGLALDIRISHSMDSLLIWLDEGTIDLNITPTSITKKNKQGYLFAGIIDTSALVLVQKKEDGKLVQTLSDLSSKTIYAEHSSVAELRLRQIQEEIGVNSQFAVAPVDTLSSEELLVKMTLNDSLNYVVAQDYIAHIVTRYFPELDMSFKISQPIRFSWVLHKDNHVLKQELDTYFDDPERKEHYKQLKEQSVHLQRYLRLENQDAVGVKLTNGAISQYDQLFIKEANRMPWHWTLLAAMAFHESTFRSEVVAWSGARGLMGIMPRTGKSYGVTAEQLLLPDVSIRVAVDCLLDYSHYFEEVKDASEQLCFTLAAYNAGVGHVQDAIRLAHKYNAPTDMWHGGVREYILLKSNPAYYNDDVVRNGYLRGTETSAYVDNIMERQNAYQALVENRRKK